MGHQRRRPLRLAVLFLAFALIIAACSGGGGGGGDSGTSTATKDGGTLSYAADQEPTGFNYNTSKDSGTSVLNVTINMFPPVFRLHPDYSVQLNKELMDSASQTSTDPQTIVYKIKPEAAWSDGTPVSAEDFVYLWKNLNGSIKGNDVAATTGYDQIESVKGSDNGKTVTVVFSEPFTDWKSLFYGLLPAQYMAKVPGGWNTGLDKNPEKIPTNGPFVISGWDEGQSLTLSRNDKYFGPKAHLDSIVFRFLPESTTQPAALQNNEVDLIYPQPQLDMVAQVKALPDVTSELNIGLSFEHLDFNFKNEHLADANFHNAIATGLNIPESVDRTVKQFTDEAQPLGNQIDQQLTADMATIPLYAKPTYLAVRNTFANVGDNATQEGPFWNSSLWGQKAT